MIIKNILSLIGKFKGDPSAYIYLKLFELISAISIKITSVYVFIVAKLKGVVFGGMPKCWGMPYLFRYPYSKIEIGRDFKVNSSFKSNNIGVFTRSRITTNDKNAEIIIGDNVGISSATISAFSKIVIGDNTLIGGNVLITDSDWHPLDPENRLDNSKIKTFPVYIGKNVFIGTRSIILKGVRIGDNSVIGAGSVVTHDIPENVIAVGNPCVVVRILN